MKKLNSDSSAGGQIKLAYTPPFNWSHLLNFYRKRAVKVIEEVGEDYYYRTFICNNTRGWFKAQLSDGNTLSVNFEIDDAAQHQNMISQIRRIFDLDADINLIEEYLGASSIGP